MKNLNVYHGLVKVKKKVFLMTAGFVLMSSLITGCKKEQSHEKVYTSIEIEKGDTLHSIAKEHMDYVVYDDVDEYIKEVKKANHLKNDTLVEGSFLIIPTIVSKEEIVQPEKEKMVAFSYEVQSGDTLSSIANTFGDSLDAIYERNSLSKDSILRDGTTLSIQTTEELYESYVTSSTHTR